MSIHKTKEKTYEVRWREQGRQRAMRFDRKIDADKFESNLRLGQIPQFLLDEKEKLKNELNFAELVDIWIRDYSEVHNAPSTAIRNRQMARDYLIPFLGRRKLSQISKKDVDQLQAKLFKGGKIRPKTVNNVIGLLGKIFSDAQGWGHIETNPTLQVKSIKCPETDFRYWTFVRAP